MTGRSTCVVCVREVCGGLADALSQKLDEVDEELARAEQPKRIAELIEERLAVALRIADVGGRRRPRRADVRPTAEKSKVADAAEGGD